MAYGQVNMLFGTMDRDIYENPDSPGQCSDTMTTATRSDETTADTYENVDTRHSNPAADSAATEYVYARPDSERLRIKPAKIAS